MQSLKAKVIAVTGGASGIGRATVLEALSQGANVVAGDMNGVALKALADETENLAGRLHTVEMNATSPEDVADYVAGGVQEFGRIDGLLVSAGITRGAPILEMSHHDWHFVLDVNLSGAFYVMQAVARQMVAQGDGGSIVAITSDLAITGQVGGGNYVASKGGLISLVKTFALELGKHQIRANTIAPGATDTPLLQVTAPQEFIDDWVQHAPLGRLGDPRDHAEMASFLLSDASAWITGQTFPVNGGSVMP
ncbi:SDR family oxidoreductase [Rhodococcus sp. USK13]|uniref:SDR family NAD(P)-dependent oxidoreductase n=1 Tax=Rhodococcus sp. USK13 TaxID=2806442 RepID=UPI001BD0208A|nr:SDR family oxidoreductase [Rhodococcus sp. USK13]